MDHDPYFAGHPPGSKPATSPTPLLVCWVTVYGLNLIVPLVLGMALTERSGRQGMTFAILLMFGLGSWAVSTLRHVGKAVIIGGGLVAVTQFMPFLQILAGSIGISAAGEMGQTVGGDQIGSEFGGFAATAVTGVSLIIVALVIGGMVLGASASLAGWRAEGKPAAKPGSMDAA